MSLSLRASTTAIAPGKSCQLLVVSDDPNEVVTPDLFEIGIMDKSSLSGTLIKINNLEYKYTAPQVIGFTTIILEDKTGIKPTNFLTSINVLKPLGLVAEIIRRELGLHSNQVYIYNQEFKIPPDERLYISVGIGTLKPFGNIKTRDSLTDQTVHHINMQAMLDINIMSKSEDALDMKEEVLMAFQSDYSQNQQTANGFYIAPITTNLTNLSNIEGSSIPYRFHFSTNIQYLVEKRQDFEYYEGGKLDKIISEG